MSTLRTILATVLLLAAAVIASGLGATDWVFRGPTGGSIRCVAPHPTDTGILLAGTDGVGILRSTDRGETWSDPQPGGLGRAMVWQIEWSPTNPDVAWAVTINPEGDIRSFYRTRDRGKTWEATTKPSTLRSGVDITFYPMKPNALIITGGSTGPFFSTDGGTSFERRATGLDRVADYGSTAVSSDERIVYQATYQGFFRTTDDGRHWERPMQLASYEWFFNVAADPFHPRRVYVTTFDQPTQLRVVLVSDDGGVTFRHIGRPNTMPVYLTFDARGRLFTTEQHWYDEGAGRWESLRLQRHWNVVFTVAFAKDEMYVGTENGISVGTLDGQSWRDLRFTTPFTPTSFITAGAGSVVVATDYRGVYTSRDGATTFTAATGIRDGRMEGAIQWPRGSNSFIAGSTSDALIRSTDGGFSWTQFSVGIPWQCLRYNFAIAADGSLFVGTWDGLFRSSGTSNVFTPVPIPLEHCYGLATSRSGRVLFANGELPSGTWARFRSSDDGATWQLLPEPAGCPPGFGVKIDPQNDRDLLLICGATLYRSTDDGASYAKVSTPGLPISVSVEQTPPYRAVLWTSDRGFALTGNWATWDLLPPVAAQYVGDVHFEGPSRLVAATSRGVATLDLTGSSPGDPATTLPLIGGLVAVTVTWRSQYSGDHGTALPLPQQDGFGYFSFFSASNPEVFVKVLDLPSQDAFWVFYAGLTDLEYTVTFTNRATGTSIAFRKPAGSFTGGADTWSLKKR